MIQRNIIRISINSFIWYYDEHNDKLYEDEDLEKEIPHNLLTPQERNQLTRSIREQKNKEY